MKFPLVLMFALGTHIATSWNLIQDNTAHREVERSISSNFCHSNQQPEYPKDCRDVYDLCKEETASGVYLIKPEGSPEPFEVYCNNSIDGGGWTVFQRRLDGSVDFYRDWSDYKKGFGFLRGEFWLGNDKISYLTNQRRYELRIDLNNLNGQPYFAKYDRFRISDERTKYRLVSVGTYDSRSTANHNSLNSFHVNQSFSTRDRDNDVWSNYNAATARNGAWWFKDNQWSCHLNGLYNAGSASFKSITWHDLPGDNNYITYSEMKIRPA